MLTEFTMRLEHVEPDLSDSMVHALPGSTSITMPLYSKAYVVTVYSNTIEPISACAYNICS